MRTLFTTFSLAALFSLATACAIDPDSIEDETAQVESDGEDLYMPSPTNDSNEYDRYCEENADCESNQCDIKRGLCRGVRLEDPRDDQ